MSRDEFLNNLREALSGRVPEQVISDNLNYYARYIDEQTGSGKSEAQVLEMLGDPRLLAKTIEGSSKFESEQQNVFGGGTYSSGGAYSGRSRNEVPDNDTHQSTLSRWFMISVIVLCVVLVLSVVFRVFFWAAPYIIVFIIVSFVIRTISKWLGF